MRIIICSLFHYLFGDSETSFFRPGLKKWRNKSHFRIFPPRGKSERRNPSHVEFHVQFHVWKPDSYLTWSCRLISRSIHQIHIRSTNPLWDGCWTDQGDLDLLKNKLIFWGCFVGTIFGHFPLVFWQFFNGKIIANLPTHGPKNCFLLLPLGHYSDGFNDIDFNACGRF